MGLLIKENRLEIWVYPEEYVKYLEKSCSKVIRLNEETYQKNKNSYNKELLTRSFFVDGL